MTNTKMEKELLEDYKIKQNKIKKRLKEFEKFSTGLYQWYYENGDIELRRSKKPCNETLFEELAYCILAAGTSAESSLKAINEIRDILEIDKAKEITRKLKKAGYRFHKQRSKYIVDAIKYRPEILQNIKDYKRRCYMKREDDMNELRNFCKEKIKGARYKVASHFLRNIGVGKNFAILDRHILNNLKEFIPEKTLKHFGAIDKYGKSKTPSSYENYKEVEKKMKEFADKIGIGMGELDLLLWSRGKILK